MIRPEFFERNDLTHAQSGFLEFIRAFVNMLKSAASSFEENQPWGAQQTAHQSYVIDELSTNCLDSYEPRNNAEMQQMYRMISVSRHASATLRRLCDAGSRPLKGLEDSREFLGSLCRCAADELDWSHKRQLLGTQHHGAVQEDMELSISELPATMCAERGIDRIQALIDFHDALLAMREIFEVVEEIQRVSDELFPGSEAKYWKR